MGRQEEWLPAGVRAPPRALLYSFNRPETCGASDGVPLVASDPKGPADIFVSSAIESQGANHC